eukprot:4808375-Pyramimonas_sp.AAC.1
MFGGPPCAVYNIGGIVVELSAQRSWHHLCCNTYIAAYSLHHMYKNNVAYNTYVAPHMLHSADRIGPIESVQSNQTNSIGRSSIDVNA